MQDPEWVRNTGKNTIYIVFMSVSDPELDPDSGVFWIRIRIWNPDPNPGA